MFTISIVIQIIIINFSGIISNIRKVSLHSFPLYSLPRVGYTSCSKGLWAQFSEISG